MSCNTLQDALSSELILNAKDITTLKQLLLNGADINYQSDEGWCLLFELISLGLERHIQEINAPTLDLHITDNKGRSALFWAIYHEHPHVIKTLLSLGYDMKLPVTQDLPALHYAVYKNNASIVSTLLEYNANINLEDKYEQTALSYAYHYKRDEMIDLLQQWGASTANLDYKL